MTHLYKIRDKEGAIVKFNPNIMQLRYIAERGAHRYNYILKARQFGFTSLDCIDYLDEALWVPGMTCAIIAHERPALDEIFQIVKRAFDGLPDAIKPEVKTNTVRMYRFTHRYDGLPLDSSIYVALKLRSGTVRKLHVSESAHIKDRQELKAGSKQAVPKSGSITEETTGNGFEDFYDNYTEADENPNPGEYDYKTYFFPWTMNPEYELPGALEEYTKDETQVKEVAKKLYGADVTDQQLIWRRWKIRDLRSKQEGVGLSGIQLFKQEYPLTKSEAFQSASGNVYDATIIDSITTPQPLPKPDDASDLLRKIYMRETRIYKMPVPGRQYVIGVDPSDGTPGGDNAGIGVWDDEAIEQVAQFYGKLRPDFLAQLAADLGNFYNEAYIGVENNMLSTILFLKDIYTNYHTTIKIDKRTKERTKKIGWTTDGKSRDVMIDDHVMLFEDGETIINSKISLNQMKTFVTKDNGKREHADGKSDDALFSDFIAIQMRKYNKARVRTFSNKPAGF